MSAFWLQTVTLAVISFDNGGNYYRVWISGLGSYHVFLWGACIHWLRLSVEQLPVPGIPRFPITIIWQRGQEGSGFPASRPTFRYRHTHQNTPSVNQQAKCPCILWGYMPDQARACKSASLSPHIYILFLLCRKEEGAVVPVSIWNASDTVNAELHLVGPILSWNLSVLLPEQRAPGSTVGPAQG